MAKNGTLVMDFPNLKSTLNQLKRLGAEGMKAFAEELRGVSEEIMSESKHLVPVDTGALRSTGHVDNAKITGDVVEITMGYGGPAGRGEHGYRGNRKAGKVAKGTDVGYAWHVHERTDIHHKYPTQAKFLEVPFIKRTKKLDEKLAIALERAILKSMK